MKRSLYVITFILIMFAGTISTAYADCRRDGRTYPTGTIIGGFICTEGGTWEKRK